MNVANTDFCALFYYCPKNITVKTKQSLTFENDFLKKTLIVKTKQSLTFENDF